MASLFGDDGAADLLNDHLQEQEQELPSDNENAGEENLFGDAEDGNDAGTQEQPITVEPKKRSVRNPRLRLTVETLRGQRGIHTIEDYYKDIQFKGKGYEKFDLDEVMRRLQHWAHRMYPTYKFDDVLNNIERLGKKKPLQVHMSRYRLGLLEHLRPNHADGELHDDEAGHGRDGDAEGAEEEPFDEFDALLGEQIAISKITPRTPAATSRPIGGGAATGMSSASSSTFATPSFHRGNAFMSTPYGGGAQHLDDTSEFAQPLPPSQPATPAAKQLTTEQMARIAENRRVAQERLRAKKLQQQQQTPAEAQGGAANA